jgi:RNA polymerase sigma-70 factor (ECF subfamily)
MMEMSATPSDFEPVLQTCWPRIYQVAMRMTGNAAEAEEVSQQAFFLAFQAWDRFEGKAQPETWLFRIAVNACRKHLMEKRRRGHASLEAQTVSYRPEDPLVARERKEGVARAMEALSPSQRLVLTLFCVDGLSHGQIAEILECPEGTVWSRLYHAKKALQEKLEAEEVGHAS